MGRILIGASIFFLALSAVFGVLNAGKARGLKTEAARSESARLESERLRAAREKEIKTREAAVAEATQKLNDDQNRVASAEAELVKSQSEKDELQAKLRANESEIAEMRKRVEEASAAVAPGGSPPPNVADLQTQLADARRQLDLAEREKSLLSDKIRSAQERSTELENEKRRRVATTGNPGVRGTVLAVNQAYNFVVLNLGGRHGIEANSEMLVLRDGTLIGRIRISSVEPSTAIGDIISTSLSRGVQVQPGDTVIYAGSNS